MRKSLKFIEQNNIGERIDDSNIIRKEKRHDIVNSFRFKNQDEKLTSIISYIKEYYQYQADANMIESILNNILKFTNRLSYENIEDNEIIEFLKEEVIKFLKENNFINLIEHSFHRSINTNNGKLFDLTYEIMISASKFTNIFKVSDINIIFEIIKKNIPNDKKYQLLNIIKNICDHLKNEIINNENICGTIQYLTQIHIDKTGDEIILSTIELFINYLDMSQSRTKNLSELMVNHITNYLLEYMERFVCSNELEFNTFFNKTNPYSFFQIYQNLFSIMSYYFYKNITFNTINIVTMLIILHENITTEKKFIFTQNIDVISIYINNIIENSHVIDNKIKKQLFTILLNIVSDREYNVFRVFENIGISVLLNLLDIVDYDTKKIVISIITKIIMVENASILNTVKYHRAIVPLINMIDIMKTDNSTLIEILKSVIIYKKYYTIKNKTLIKKIHDLRQHDSHDVRVMTEQLITLINNDKNHDNDMTI